MGGSGWTIRRAAILAVLMWACAPGLLAGAQRLESWKIFYLNGIGAEAQHQYGRALRFFDEARKLQSRPIKNEWFAQYGRYDYDPPYHIAKCLVQLGGEPEVIEAWIRASRRGGVTPPEALDEVLDDLHRRQGTPIPTRIPTPTATPAPPLPTGVPQPPPASPAA